MSDSKERVYDVRCLHCKTVTKTTTVMCRKCGDRLKRRSTPDVDPGCFSVPTAK